MTRSSWSNRSVAVAREEITYLWLVEEGKEVLSAYATGDPVREHYTIGLDVHGRVHRVWSVDGEVVWTFTAVVIRELVSLAHCGAGGRGRDEDICEC